MSNQPDRVEFYVMDGGMIAYVDSAIVPPVNSRICIEKIIYKVVFVSYAIDHNELISGKRMRANVTLKRTKEKPI